jgi:hypothetical protein
MGEGRAASYQGRNADLKCDLRGKSAHETPPFPRDCLLQIRVPSLERETDRLWCYGVSGAGVDVGVGTGTSTPAISSPATRETAVRIIVNAVSIPDTVSRSIRADMLR